MDQYPEKVNKIRNLASVKKGNEWWDRPSWDSIKEARYACLLNAEEELQWGCVQQREWLILQSTRVLQESTAQQALMHCAGSHNQLIICFADTEDRVLEDVAMDRKRKNRVKKNKNMTVTQRDMINSLEEKGELETVWNSKENWVEKVQGK